MTQAGALEPGGLVERRMGADGARREGDDRVQCIAQKIQVGSGGSFRRSRSAGRCNRPLWRTRRGPHKARLNSRSTACSLSLSAACHHGNRAACAAACPYATPARSHTHATSSSHISSPRVRIGRLHMLRPGRPTLGLLWPPPARVMRHRPTPDVFLPSRRLREARPTSVAL